MIGDYIVFTDAGIQRRLQAELRERFKHCRDSLREALELEEYEEDGTISLTAFRQAFIELELNLSDEQLDFIVYSVYIKSESSQRLRHGALFEMLDDEALAASASEGRKRPESSSPEKLKARNKDKFEQVKQAQLLQKDDEVGDEDGDDYDDDFDEGEGGKGGQGGLDEEEE